MRENQQLLADLLQITEEIYGQVKAIDSKLNQNELEQVEYIPVLLEKREMVIKQLDAYKQDFQWTHEDKQKIEQLRILNQELQPMMNSLHQSFLKQINRMNQRKQMSKKYIGAYQNMTIDGSFIDKRK